MTRERSKTPGAARMRLLRKRRRRGFACCVSVKVYGYEIEQMVRAGLLWTERRRDRKEIARAIGRILDGWYQGLPPSGPPDGPP
jgi:hypothetical protein